MSNPRPALPGPASWAMLIESLAFRLGSYCRRMLRVIVALAIVIVAVVVAIVIRGRRRDAPTAVVRGRPPAQLDRQDFPRSDAPWLVVVFSSSTCESCADVVEKTAVLDSRSVAVTEVEFRTDRALHERYHIDAVPITVVAGDDGVVHRSFVGPVTATDLWAALAELRDPGSTPEPGLGTER